MAQRDFRKTLKGLNVNSPGCNPGLMNECESNPEGVEHRLICT